MNSGNGRFLELDFNQNGSQVSAILPADSLRLMPGFYMLFGRVDDIPAAGQILKIEAGKAVLSGTTDAPFVEKQVLRIFPNPVSGQTSVSVEIEANENGRIELVWHDAAGRRLAQVSGFEKTAQRQSFSIPAPASAQGNLMLSVWVGGRLLGSAGVVFQ